MSKHWIAQVNSNMLYGVPLWHINCHSKAKADRKLAWFEHKWKPSRWRFTNNRWNKSFLAIMLAIHDTNLKNMVNCSPCQNGSCSIAQSIIWAHVPEYHNWTSNLEFQLRKWESWCIDRVEIFGPGSLFKTWENSSSTLPGMLSIPVPLRSG